MTAEAWRARAACRDVDPDLFFPEVGGIDNGTREAKAVCARCPVISDCRAYVERMESVRGYRGPHGIWGGLSEEDRRRARRRAQKGTAA